MSGLTPTALYEFRRLLWGRDFPLELLAAALPVGRSHLSQVLWGYRPSPETWQKVRAWVTPDEWAILLQLEHCATWNKAQEARESAGERAWLMRRQCATCKKWEGYVPCVAASAHKITHGICPDCYRREILDVIAASPQPIRRPYLVKTESATRPELASDRELTPEDFSGSAQAAPISCAPGVGPRAA
jgi:hypothetical protein